MIQLYNQDCMEAMSKMKDNEFDLAIVDPPYGIGDFASGKRNKDINNKKILSWNKFIPTKNYFEELKRVSKNQIIWGCNYYPNLQGGRIIWYKHVKVPNFSKCEIAYCSMFQKVEYIDLIWQNINRNEHIIHPCQKPSSLYKILLDKFSKKGWKILDTHLGSGSSAIAAHDMGYDFVGYELDNEYFLAAQKRLTEHQKQLKLFA
jgi:site-specific DNA-methyltransferase (adenine-specific)